MSLIVWILIVIVIIVIGIYIEWLYDKSSQKTSNRNNQEKPGSNLKGGELGNCDVSSIPDTNTKSDVEDS